jgi:hypothetical protein
MTPVVQNSRRLGSAVLQIVIALVLIGLAVTIALPAFRAASHH